MFSSRVTSSKLGFTRGGPVSVLELMGTSVTSRRFLSQAGARLTKGSDNHGLRYVRLKTSIIFKRTELRRRRELGDLEGLANVLGYSLNQNFWDCSVMLSVNPIIVLLNY